LRVRLAVQVLEDRAMPSVQAALYVAPWGSDANPGTYPNQPFQTLEHAQAVVRTMNGSMTGDIVVNLRGGTYALASTWTLSTADSGTNGHNVIWQAYPGEVPLLSGGREITGWTFQDPVKNIWEANVGSLQFRQLYVGGLRANLARSAGGLPGSVTKTATGYITTDTSLQNFRRPGDLEFVYSGPDAMASWYAQWVEDRIGVAGISGTPTSTTITMRDPAWGTATHIPRSSLQDVAYPSYLENAYEFLSHPGDWYLDHTAGVVYYIPRAGEDMATVQVIAPELQTLVQGKGDSLAAPLHNVQFKGITFTYAGWLGPTLGGGFVDWQADWGLNSGFQGVRMPANVVFQTVQSIRLEGDNFTHLGGAGLDLYGGSQNNVVIGNTFADISGSGLQIGDISDPLRSDPRARDQYNLIADNYVHDVAAEYHGGVGIFLGYVAYTTVSHNEVYNTPYTGISLGWGWGLSATYMQDNQVTSNDVHDYMELLGDGGALYTLGAQPHSTIADNWFHNTPMPRGYWGGALYNDNGSAGFEDAANVLSGVPRWYFINPGCHDICVHDNFLDTTAAGNVGSSNVTVSNNTVVSSASWQAAALAIMNNAGVNPSDNGAGSATGLVFPGNSPIPLAGEVSLPVTAQRGDNAGTPAVTVPAEAFTLQTQQEGVNLAPLSAAVFTTGTQTPTPGNPSAVITIPPEDAKGNVAAGVVIKVTTTSRAGTFSDTVGRPLLSPTLAILANAPTADLEYQDT
jgi:hypothetical protein